MAGVGYTVLKNAVQEFDVRADVHYEKQQFFTPASNLNLLGSTFGETYVRTLPRAIVFNEFGAVSLAWNDTNAYSARFGGNLVFPVYRGFCLQCRCYGRLPEQRSGGFKQNSVTFTSGITYAFTH